MNEPQSSASTPIFFAGLAFVVIAAGASLLMALEHLVGLSLPGCGAGSACARAAASVWGRIPILEWPISYIGLAYFAGVAAAWVRTRGRLGGVARAILVAGAGLSVLYLGVMFGKGMVCRYCLATHAGNLGFVALAFAARPSGRRSGPGLWAGAPAVVGVFAAATALLGAADLSVKKEVRKQAQGDLDRSLAEIRKGTTRAPEPANTSQAAAPKQSAGPETTKVQSPPIPTPAPAAGPKAFTGRYRIGPEKAGVRVVIFTDYQCPDCKRIEGQLEELLAASSNISLSIKHWPFCPDCNKTPNVPNLHANACWAARAAETAGILYGPGAFHRMHQWLFEKNGVFRNEAELEEGLRALGVAGVNTAQFISVMSSDAPLRNITEDIEEGVALGLARSPMIFINGVELKGWHLKPDAVAEAVRGLLATNPEPRGPENDRPPRAFAKAIADWREQIAQAWPRRQRPYAFGGTYAAPVQITIFGDFQEVNTAATDRVIRDYILGREDVRYEFRYYPVDPTCNPNIPSNDPRFQNVSGCRGARAAEAAGQLGGDRVYARMHEWLMQNQQRIGDDAALRSAAAAMGLDPEAFWQKMESPEVAQLIATDVSIGQRLGMPEIPRVFVNGKMVPRWNVPGGGVLETIIEEATRPPPQPVQVVDPLKGLNLPRH
jgi:predicted DsbA family dithiol-disulfide isomerase/uncharacterized membrane protein